MLSTDDNNNLINIIKLNYLYPNEDDEDMQLKIFKKREYYFNKVPNRQILLNYEDIKNFRDKECGDGKFELQSHQALLSNFINPDTPYKGLLIFHGVGTGKTCTAYAIAENFKSMVKKYNTKIYILLSGPLIKEQWKNELIKVCAKDTYLKDINKEIGYLNEIEMNKIVHQAKSIAMQYYKIISYRSFQKKVLGQKIIDKSYKSNKIKQKKTYKKTIEGEIERDLSIDNIDSLNNTLLIVDEAHNLTGNEYGQSVKKIINNSKNLRVLLLTATPMKNLGDNIIELINLLRPEQSQISRDLIFTGSSHLMEFKTGGKEYLYKMINGYVSYFRGANPLTFPEIIENGEIVPGLNFTKVTRCYMDEFQLNSYNDILNYTNDALDRQSQSVSNCVIPGLNHNKEIIGYSGEEGINIIRNQLKVNRLYLINKINEKFYNSKYPNPNELLIDDNKNKSLVGKIFKLPYLKFFSIKFYTCLNNINNVVIGKKGPGTIFIYSNLVKVGVEIFKEVLLQNGYLEYNEDKNYIILDDTLDSLTGLTYKEFINTNDPTQFHPAVFIVFSGKHDEGIGDVPEYKINILNKHFNVYNNKDGKYIKIILGSKVMNEGITLKNIKEVHILDVYYNLGRIHQIIGRAIRRCSHYNMITNENQFPKVEIYKYVVSLHNNILSAEEELYIKAETKYILVKEIERIIKEAAIDCPLNYNGNIFPEEIIKYKDCLYPAEYNKLSIEEKKKKMLCPVSCDFQKCIYKCFNSQLNNLYYDNQNNNYLNINPKDIDYLTFTSSLKKNEINNVKEKIKDLYKFKYVYILDELIENIKKTYQGEKKELFEDFFVYRALNDLIPLDENDFNNYQDYIYDKYNKPGYLIFRDNYYIFQPFDQNENIPMWYRSNYMADIYNELTLYNYITNTKSININDNIDKIKNNNILNVNNITININYDFSNIDYYNTKKDYIYVGIIDKESNRSHTNNSISNNIFKLRPALNKILNKKRGINIYSLKGAVCYTSKDKDLLIKIATKIGIKDIDKCNNDTKYNICNIIKDRLLFLEKYSTTKDNNKYLYMIIPSNHPIYEFPYNLEDRITYIINQLQNKITILLTYRLENIKNGIFLNVRNNNLARYKLYLTNNNSELNEFKQLLELFKFNFIDNIWFIIIE